MSSPFWNGRKTALAGLLALALLLGSMVVGPSAHAGGPTAVFHGYVVPEAGGVLPTRVRAFSESGTVCGSAEVSKLGAAWAGFYVLLVVSGDTKDGCPTAGENVRLAVAYGLVDDDIFVGPPLVFRTGLTTSASLVCSATDTSAALALP